MEEAIVTLNIFLHNLFAVEIWVCLSFKIAGNKAILFPRNLYSYNLFANFSFIIVQLLYG